MINYRRLGKEFADSSIVLKDANKDVIANLVITALFVVVIHILDLNITSSLLGSYSPEVEWVGTPERLDIPPHSNSIEVDIRKNEKY